MQADADYYARLPIFDGFASVMDPARYQPLPDDWVLGLTDVVSSTKAIEQGRYKAVNTAGASVIAAVSNALGGRKFPFAFGGDGARCARRDRRLDARRSPARASRCAGSRFRGERTGAQRQRGPIRTLEERFVRDVLRRRACVGRSGDEARTLRRVAGSAGHASRPERLVLSLERHSCVPRV